MKLNAQQTKKVASDLRLISKHLTGLQKSVLDEIKVSFAEHCTLFISEKELYGTYKTLRVTFDKNEETTITKMSAYNYKDYAIALIVNWPEVKASIEEQIEEHKKIIQAIENFEV